LKSLTEQRRKMGLSQKQVSSECGIKQGYYSRIERGICKPSVGLAKKLSAVLKINWVEFFN